MDWVLDGPPRQIRLATPRHSGTIPRMHARNANASPIGIDFLVLGLSNDGLTAPNLRSTVWLAFPPMRLVPRLSFAAAMFFAATRAELCLLTPRLVY